jgi:hypothetical protein
VLARLPQPLAAVPHSSCSGVASASANTNASTKGTGGPHSHQHVVVVPSPLPQPQRSLKVSDRREQLVARLEQARPKVSSVSRYRFVLPLPHTAAPYPALHPPTNSSNNSGTPTDMALGRQAKHRRHASNTGVVEHVGPCTSAGIPSLVPMLDTGVGGSAPQSAVPSGAAVASYSAGLQGRPSVA